MVNFFKNKTIVFTGELSLNRDYAKSQIILLGGRCTNAISGKTDILVVGVEPGPAKLKKANELKIKIMYEPEFVLRIEEGMKTANVTVDIVKKDTGMAKSYSHDNSDAEDSKIEFGRELISFDNWAEKYRPLTKKDIVGNQTVISQLEDFLLGKTKFKGALLSGSPGIGKTTSVMVLCKELNFDLIEFNASDVRNKSLITSKIKGLINIKSLSFTRENKKKVILMDEVDGMSGDRGGLQELNTIIKTSLVPIVCICNDRNNLKIRTLANNCLDLKFRKLDSRSLINRLRTILKKEDKEIGDNILNEIINQANNDFRYILNTLQKICLKKTLNLEDSENIIRKDLSRNVFEIATELFHKKSINDKSNLYFEDYSLIPLFVSENYLKANYKTLNEVYNSAEALSISDSVDKLIRGSQQEYSLLPLHAFYSVVMPTLNKTLNKRIDFPSWLGQNSKQQKNLRNLKDVKFHAATKINSSAEEFRKYESNLIYLNFINYLKGGKMQNVMNIFIQYELIKEDMMNLIEILLNGTILFKEIGSKTKGEFTRMYNKLKRKLVYVQEDVKKNKNDVETEEDEIEDFY